MKKQRDWPSGVTPEEREWLDKWADKHERKQDMPKQLRPPERGEKITLIKQLLTEFPAKGNKELVGLFNERAAAAGIEMTTRGDGQEIATARSALKKGKGGTQSPKTEQPAAAPEPELPAPASRPTAPGRADEDEDEPTASELMRVREMAERRGGMAEFSEMVTEVERMAEDVGGFGRLRACLEFWSKVKAGE